MPSVFGDKALLNSRYQSFRVGWNWYKFDLLSVDELPKAPCCYVVYGDGKIVYIGSTVNLCKRFKTGGHKCGTFWTSIGINRIELYKTPWGEFKDLYIKARFSDFIGDWAQKEIYLIYRLRPSGNLTYNWR